MAAPMSETYLPDGSRTGIMVAMRPEGPILCPFFARCDGLVVFAADGAIETFPADPARGEQAMCDLISKCRVERLVCGFIAEPYRALLRARGVDIRLGSCREAIPALAARFDALPSA
jgi:hypothetical protein